MRAQTRSARTSPANTTTHAFRSSRERPEAETASHGCRSAPRPPADLAERDQFQKLVAESLPSVRASAETWRNGLAAFITLVTTAVVIKGRSTTAEVPAGWRIAITVLIALGLALAVVGLWQALADGQAKIQQGLDSAG